MGLVNVKHRRFLPDKVHTPLLGETGGLLAEIGQVNGVAIFQSERESREIAAAWRKINPEGWPSPADHAKVVEERDAFAAEVERLNGLCTELESNRMHVMSVKDVLEMQAQGSAPVDGRAKAAA